MTFSLNTICQMTRNPTMLNALHACREGHPLNKITPTPWRNAHFLALQQSFLDIPSDALAWLKKQADKEVGA